MTTPFSSSDVVPLATLIHMVTIRLSSSNYLLWKSQVLPMLRCDSLSSFVDGSSKPPSPMLKDADSHDSPNPEYSAWCKKNDRVVSLLLSSLTEEAVSEVVGLTDAREVWPALESAFAPSSPSHAHQLRDELQFLRRGTSSVVNFTRTFQNLCHQLAAIGQPVTGADKCRWFLRGLGLQFRTFADVRLANTPQLSFRELISQARYHELRDKALEVADPSPPAAAFYAARPPSAPSSLQYK
ncbi:hypothetical protein ACS0TY_022323 [Phlomoides rotata]